MEAFRFVLPGDQQPTADQIQQIATKIFDLFNTLRTDAASSYSTTKGFTVKMGETTKDGKLDPDCLFRSLHHQHPNSEQGKDPLKTMRQKVADIENHNLNTEIGKEAIKTQLQNDGNLKDLSTNQIQAKVNERLNHMLTFLDCVKTTCFATLAEVHALAKIYDLSILVIEKEHLLFVTPYNKPLKEVMNGRIACLVHYTAKVGKYEVDIFGSAFGISRV